MRKGNDHQPTTEPNRLPVASRPLALAQQTSDWLRRRRGWWACWGWEWFGGQPAAPRRWAHECSGSPHGQFRIQWRWDRSPNPISGPVSVKWCGGSGTEVNRTRRMETGNYAFARDRQTSPVTPTEAPPPANVFSAHWNLFLPFRQQRDADVTQSASNYGSRLSARFSEREGGFLADAETAQASRDL